MKSYTDIDQSKKLAEILPLESADMMHDNLIVIPFNDGSCTPCWSLAALLGVLKYPSLTQDLENKWSIMDWTGAYPKSEYSFDNPIDACYKMINKLHEQKLL